MRGVRIGCDLRHRLRLAINIRSFPCLPNPSSTDYKAPYLGLWTETFDIVAYLIRVSTRGFTTYGAKSCVNVCLSILKAAMAATYLRRPHQAG